MLQAFPGLQARASGDCTLLRGTLPDPAALYGVLAQLEALGLELVELRQLRSSSRRLSLRASRLRIRILQRNWYVAAVR